MIKDPLARLVANAVRAAREAGALPLPPDAPLPAAEIGAPPDPALGDYATNVALTLAKSTRLPAHEVARIIAERLSPDDSGGLLESVYAASSGFINFRLAPHVLADTLRTIVAAGDDWGRSDLGQGRRALFEFVSANPNGPITVAHGRGGAIGDVLAALWERTGWQVSREFYVNDVTNAPSLRAFTLAVWKRYRQLIGPQDEGSGSPGGASNGDAADDEYPAETVTGLAQIILQRDGQAHAHLGPDEAALLRFQERVLGGLQADQRATLEAFGVRFDEWRSEASLYASGAVERILARLRESGHADEQSGALWLRSTRFGDANDRVLVRADNRTPTYIAADLVYHDDKFARGFDRLVNVFGADHTGYVARTRAGLAALGHDPDRLQVIVYQSVRLIEDGNAIKAGDPGSGGPSLSELVAQIGRDAARFFLLLRSPDVPLDLDLTLARARTRDNPLYRTQLAHIRCCEAIRRATAQGVPVPDSHPPDLSLLTDPTERTLIRTLADLPDEIRHAAMGGAPHRIVQYSLVLADQFHAYCEHGEARREGAARLAPPENEALSQARLALTLGVRSALRGTLALLGVEAPDALTSPDDGEDLRPVANLNHHHDANNAPA
jgi:arginyl-tRNA synthetase